MYSGMPTPIKTTAATTSPNRRFVAQVATKASTSTSTPRVPAAKRWVCSRHALWVSTGRLGNALSALATAAGFTGQVTRP